MKASSFISGRITFRGRAAVASIAVSFLVMIIAISIAGGFRSEIRKGLGALIGDIRVTCLDGGDYVPFAPDSRMLEEISGVHGVDSLKQAIYSTGIVRNGSDIHGVVFKGIETADSASMDVIIPARLAGMLSLKAGDRMLTYFVGDGVVLRNFKIRGIYDAVSTGDDKMVVFCDIHMLRRVNRWDRDKISALEIILDERNRGEAQSLLINSRISHILYGYSDENALVSTRSCTVYKQIFDWLTLIDFNVAFILILMTVVAGLNMISGLLILLFENISTIGLLKSLGMRKKDIAATFLKSSSTLILRGMLIGNALSLFLCFLQEKTHLFRLNPENYFVSFLPVKIDWVTILSCDILAFCAIILILFIPCAFISKVDPAQSMRVK